MPTDREKRMLRLIQVAQARIVELQAGCEQGGSSRSRGEIFDGMVERLDRLESELSTYEQAKRGDVRLSAARSQAE